MVWSSAHVCSGRISQYLWREMVLIYLTRTLRWLDSTCEVPYLQKHKIGMESLLKGFSKPQQFLRIGNPFSGHSLEFQAVYFWEKKPFSRNLVGKFWMCFKYYWALDKEFQHKTVWKRERKLQWNALKASITASSGYTSAGLEEVRPGSEGHCPQTPSF